MAEEPIQLNTRRSFLLKLVRLSLPIMLQNLLMVTVNAADVFMLGYVSQNALSAVSLAGQTAFVYQLFMMGLATGVSVLTSQHWGKGDTDSIEKVYGVALRCSALLSAVFFLAALILPRELMSLFTSDAALIDIGAEYLSILSFTFLFQSASLIYTASARSVERVVVCMVIGGVTLLLNVGLNASFIFGLCGLPKLGVRGVAIATVIARAVELLLCMLDAYGNKKLKLRLSCAIKRDAALSKRFFKYTLPALMNYLVWGGGFTMYSVILGHLGVEIVAANSVISVVRNIAVVFGTALGSGGSILIGMELGENRIDEARVNAGRLCKAALIAGLFGGLLIIAARPLIMQWSGLTETARAYLDTMIWINAYYCIGKAINSTVVGGIFCAGGDTKFGLICDAVDMWAVILPISALMAFVFRLSPLMVYFVICLDEFIKLPFVYRHYKKYRWLNNITVQNAQDGKPNGGNENV